ncbi:MAG: preprotein translocase subunit SecG [Desulfobacteraceae bacterium]|nr:preprotein translocase subunit SecG [Desulfobacteraceae bacterium]
MTILITVIHIIVCVALILIVLLQTGKGADMGAAFGGGASQTLFGATGASTFLSKATTAAAIIFMLTSLTLAYMSANKGSARLVKETPAAQKQTTTESAPASAPAEGQNAAPSTSESKPAAKENSPAASESQPVPQSGAPAPADQAAPKAQ